MVEVATTNQLFQLNGALYEQVEGVAMGVLPGAIIGQHVDVLYRGKTRREKRLQSIRTKLFTRLCVRILCYSCLLGILLHISLIIDLIMTLSECRNVVAFLNL